MKRLVTIFTIALAALAASALNPLDDIIANPRRAASNHFAYPVGTIDSVPSLTAAPAGYEPFYICHYGRHGSRWLSSDKYVGAAMRDLTWLDRGNMLTPDGERLLATMRMIGADSEQRFGDLTDVGAEQHQAIASRMMKNFPEALGGDATIDARSTTVIRCILSMQNATTTLMRLNPRLRITTDASLHDMHYMGWGYGEDTLANPIRKQMDLITDSLYATRVDASRFMRQIVRDDMMSVALEHINAGKLMKNIFDIAGNLQSHHCYDNFTLYHLFTTDELFTLWKLRNIFWYTHWANAPQNGNRMPFIERALLHDMIEKCDSAIARGERGASLRFGHESCLLPLACLMELDDVNYGGGDLDTLHEHWQDYNIIPKGCNIQIVLYRPIGNERPDAEDVLVKVLLNEHEAELPDGHVTGPYYNWEELSHYWIHTLSRPTAWPE